MKEQKKHGKIIHIFFDLIIMAMVLCIIAMFLAPERVFAFTGYRLYAVQTDSMEPLIPTYSLVCSRIIQDDDILKPGEIITFWGERFGDRILLTHHFHHTEQDEDGTTLYRTNAEGTEELDMYKVERKDIVGIYMFHIPYVGKYILFIKSSYGLLLMAEILIILLINRVITARWEEEEHKI